MEVFKRLLIFSPVAEAFFYDRQGTFGNVQVLERAALDPLDAAGIVSRAKLSAGDTTDVVEKHVVVLGSALAWALATAAIRESQPECDPLAFTASYLLVGGVTLVVTGLATGDAGRWTWSPLWV